MGIVGLATRIRGACDLRLAMGLAHWILDTACLCAAWPKILARVSGRGKRRNCMVHQRLVRCVVTHFWSTVVPSAVHASAVERDPATESAIYNILAHLRGLQSLSLHVYSCGTAHSPEGVRRHATCVAQLSALSALTSLKLELPGYCQGQGNSWQQQQQQQQQQQEGEQHAARFEAQEAHRTSVLSTMRCMPQLQHLDCPTLWLQPSEAASLTALTSLTMQGVLPPPGALEPAQRGAAVTTAASGGLPPQLRKLTLHATVSPRVLALLQPPACFAVLNASRLCFGVSDVDPEGRLRPEAVQAMGPAVRLIVAFKDRSRYRHEIILMNDGSHGRLLPREGSPNGHSEWIQQLQGLDAFAELTLRRFELRTGDLACLGQALPRLTGKKGRLLACCTYRTSANDVCKGNRCKASCCPIQCPSAFSLVA